MAQVRQKRSMRKIFLEVVGAHEGNNERFWTIWFMFALIIGLVTNFVVLLGCMSSSTQKIYLFRVSSRDLIDATTNVTRARVQDLSVAGLPSHWYWSLSGVCAMYPDNQPDVSCTRSFPPTLTIYEMLTFGIEASLPSSTSNATAEAESRLQPWAEALSTLSASHPFSARPQPFSKAAAALTILSTISSFALLVLAVLSLSVLRNKLRRWMLYILAFLDAGMFLGAGVMLIYSMNEGPQSIIQLSNIDQGNERTSNIGPGFFVLFGGVIFKLISIGAFFCIAFSVFIMIVFAVLACMSEVLSGDSRKADVVYIENSDSVYVGEDAKRY